MKINITIIICAFNEENYICRALNSVINQSYMNLEIIVVNDASTDATLEILKIYENFDNRIKIVQNKINSGLGKSRNIGLTYATGNYVTFIDADDFYSDRMYIEDIVNILSVNPYDVVITPYLRNIKGKNVYDRCGETSEYQGEVAAEYYISRAFGTHGACGKFFKTTLFSEHKFSDFGYSEDVLCMLQIIVNAGKVFFYKRYGYVYFRNSTSITNPKNITLLNVYSSLRLISEVFIYLYKMSCDGINIKADAFISTWKQNHLPILESFINCHPDYNCFDLVSKFRAVILSLCNTQTLRNQFNNILNLNMSCEIDIKYKKYLSSIQTSLCEIKSNKIIIYASKFSSGGLEKVAAQLSVVLSELGYDVINILESVDRIDYKYSGKILKACLHDFNILKNINESSFLFDFVYKTDGKEYPIIYYYLDNFPHRYISTIHNTKTCKNYFAKIASYIGKKNISELHSIICVSESVNKEFVKNYGKHKNIITIYNPVDIHTIDNVPSVCELKQPYILFCGRLNATQHKGIDFLINAFASSLACKSHFLVLMGAGKLETSIMQLIAELNIADRIINVGYKNNVYSYMKCASFLFQPSRWEGFSLAIIEALACQTPVLSSDTGGASEIITHLKNGYIFVPEDVDAMIDGINYMIDHAYLMKKNCKPSIEKLYMDSYKKSIHELLTRIN